MKIDITIPLSVGEVARRSGVTIATVHHYEAKGLIQSWRSDGNQRRYHREVLRKIAVIKIAQRAGIPLATIKEALDELPSGKPLQAKDWALLSTRWRDMLTSHVADGRQLLREPRQLIDEQLRLAEVVAGGPAPSVEAILHALIPARFVDHTHAVHLLLGG